MLVGKAGFAEFHFRSEAAEAFHRIVVLYGLDDAFDPVRDVLEVNRRNHGFRKAVLWAVFHQVVHVSGLDEGFARHAAVVEAVPAETGLFFDQNGFSLRVERLPL